MLTCNVEEESELDDGVSVQPSAPAKSPFTPINTGETKIDREHMKLNKDSLLRKSTSIKHKVSAGRNCCDCLKSAKCCGSKDDETQNKANALLWKMICEYWCIILL